MVSLAAVGAACVFAVLLSVRLVNSSDLGYHLAYGETFFATGRAVDTNPFIYTLSEGPPLVDRGKIGPGCWYDGAGVYHFANANWLSQLVITVLYRWGGIAAMSLMVAVCVAVLVGLCLLMMRRSNVPWVACAAGVLVVALAAQGRFQPRPEVFGYVLLVAQLHLLLAPLGRQRLIPAWAIVALVILQVLMVNAHSYFLLSLAMSFSVLADLLLRLAWRRLKRQADSPPFHLAARNASRMGVVVGGQLAACLVNPWTWRLALLPIQTLTFLRENDIAATKFFGPRHPWSAIAEFTNTLGTMQVGSMSGMSWAVLAVLALAGIGCLAALAQRRWAEAMILAGMGAVALSMLRNVAPVAFVIVPVGLAVLRRPAGRIVARLAPVKARVAGLLSAGVVVVLSAYWSIGVITGGFYLASDSAERFGLGFSRLRFPLGAAEWLNEHKPVGRMWTDFNLSSDLHYFTRPHRDVPVLTNTWAFPPDVMRMVLDHVAGLNFEDMRRRYDIEIVAVENGITAESLVRTLSHDPNWAVVYMSPCHMIFLRREGPNAELARSCQITAETLDIRAYGEWVASLDPQPQEALFVAGIGFYRIKWDAPAIALLEETIPHRRPNHVEWNTLGICYGRQAMRRLQAKDNRGADDLVKARQCFEEALRLEPDYKKGRQNLSLVRRQIESLRQGVLLLPEE